MEQLSNSWLVFVLLGVFAGVVSGTLGIGSGTVIVPALVLFFSFAQKNAQGIALAVIVPTALTGAILYWKNPEIDMKLAIIGLLICGAIVGAFIGAKLAGRLPENILRKAFAIFLLIIAVRMFINPAKTGAEGLEKSSVKLQNADLAEPEGADKGTSGR